MKINLEWLSEYVDLPNPAEELIDVLPMLGIEVEENDDAGTLTLENVVVGKVCLLYTSPSPRDVEESRMPSSA